MTTATLQEVTAPTKRKHHVDPPKKESELDFSIVTIALFCVFISTSTSQTVLFYLVYGFFDSMTMPITTSIVPKIVPPKSRGTAYSFQFIPTSVIGIVMPIILGMLISLFEIWLIFPIAIIFYIIVLVITQIRKCKCCSGSDFNSKLA